MNIYWKIVREDTHGRTQYLQNIRPTHWSLLPEDGIRFDDIGAMYACRCLIKMGVSFSVRQICSP